MNRVEKFVRSEKEYPLLAGLIVGFYMLLFYYSNNFDLANSYQQFLFFTCYFVVLPMLVCGIGYYLFRKTRLKSRARQVVFVLMLSFFGYYISQHLGLSISWKKVTLAWIFAVGLLSFKFSNYKVVIVLLSIMSLFPAFTLAKIILRNASAPTDWNKQPDDIVSAKFKKSPNIYYLQPDGYANAATLKGKLYDYDNSTFDAWLTARGFTHYDNFRSNYNSTLKSNASCFNMSHHFSNENSLLKNANDYIIGENPVLEVFKRNGYKRFFITERPYLLMNRPDIAFDYTNFKTEELPFLQDGWSFFKPISEEFKKQVRENKNSKTFFFVEKFDPGHIAVHENYSQGKAGERQLYLMKLKIANDWLRETVDFIVANDPDAMIIIGADHGGFVGFDYSWQIYDKITDKQLLHSAFGAKLAIRWNGNDSKTYDSKLKTSVNLFRCVFSYLSEDPKYLDHVQSDASYNTYDKNDETKIYKALD
ncbi:MAG: hypothetical protein EOO50_15150 [Flavobacterium sp.]|uniref:hypothetical protein n=1 Tax=Flavobacterium sp. TaxID=239 RepID=UPI0012123F3E|nr:hypothetical protein [Flavobacterium sp.]RZJ65110.1 MAG: hypothetical protein EOO50_15150 [Flavobacterium sp.]